MDVRFISLYIFVSSCQLTINMILIFDNYCRSERLYIATSRHNATFYCCNKCFPRRKNTYILQHLAVTHGRVLLRCITVSNIEYTFHFSCNNHIYLLLVHQNYLIVSFHRMKIPFGSAMCNDIHVSS